MKKLIAVILLFIIFLSLTTCQKSDVVSEDEETYPKNIVLGFAQVGAEMVKL